MVVFVMDSRNRLGHPTTKLGMIGRLLRRGKAKIVKKYKDVMLVQIFKRFERSKTIDCEFRIGIDPGYKHIGFALFKIFKKSITKLFSGEVETRTSDVTKNLSERKMFRNVRRYYRRKNVKRKFGHVKFRKPIWKNRAKHKFQPTHIHLINSHNNILTKIFNLVPIDQSKIHIEYSKFDIHKIINPNIYSWRYQKGLQYGFENVKSYVRDRDGYKCQACKTSKDIVLEVHHILERSNGGGDRPDNLITLCSSCHKKIHSGKISCPSIKSKQFRDAGVLNSCMKHMYEELVKYIPTQITYGYITKTVRLSSNISKTHADDASIIAFSDSLGLQDITSYNWTDYDTSINFKQYRRHVRNYIIRHEDRKYYIPESSKKILAWNRNRRSGQTDEKKRSLVELKRVLMDNNINHNIVAKKGGAIKRKNNSQIKFRPGDTIKYDGEYHSCKGWASTRSGVILEDLGEIKQRLCQKVLNNSGLVFAH